MEENPVLEIAEEEPELPAEEAEPEEREPPDAPTEEERELVIDETHANEGDFERLMKMDEEWPDHFEERSPSVARRGRRGRRAQARRDGQHGRPAADRCRIICTTSWAGSIWSRSCGRWPTASSTTSTPTAICKAGWRTCWAPTPAQDDLALAQRALGAGAEARPARRRRPRPARVPAACSCARHAVLRAASHADLQPSGRPGAQPPAGHLRVRRATRSS